jgi:transcriptional regulator GlxA family with amidase domain
MLRSSTHINTKAFDYFPPLRKIREYFEENYSEPISLRRAAGIVGLEQKYFSKMFRSHVGIGFKEWTNLTRIRKALEAIQKEDRSLMTVAFAVGFQSPATFQRQFKKHARMRPSDYKRAMVRQIGRTETPVVKRLALRVDS